MGVYSKKRSPIVRQGARSERISQKAVTNRMERCPLRAYIPKSGHQSYGKVPVLSVYPKKRSRIVWISARSVRISQKAVTNRKD